MVAERDNETVRIERVSVLVVVAKARVWASEGWQVTITDADGREFDPAGFESVVMPPIASAAGSTEVPNQAMQAAE